VSQVRFLPGAQLENRRAARIIRFAAQVTIPTGATAGDHQVRGFGRVSGLIAVAAFTVT